MKLQPYNIQNEDIIHKPGKKHLNADALSRVIINPAHENSENENL